MNVYGKTIKTLIVMVMLMFVLLQARSAFAVANYANGFETNTDGWFNDGVEINRVASGTNGVASADGSYHAQINAGAFTRWGGYESVFPSDGYVTQVDIYLDMSLADGSDKRFDFSSAINNPSGTHRRDFIFSVGTVPGGSGQWVMSASNNSPGWPGNPARNPLTVSQTGWYTFRHTFQSNAGVLEVVMDVLDASGNVLGFWTLSDPTDVVGTTVGGNRYGWFVNSGFAFLAVDNTEKYNVIPLVGPPTDKEQCKDGGWQGFNNPSFRNQGECVSFVNHNS